MTAPEIELKFSVEDIRRFRSTVGELGFQLVTERTFESNTLYDTADRQLRGRKQILRVRQYGERWTVTHKRTAGAEQTGQRYKTRIETESVVEDGEAMAEVFSQLGYGPVFRYEKYRTEWDLDGGHLVLDETPIGVWAELEGPTAWIDQMLVEMGVEQERCSTDSYGKLFSAMEGRDGKPGGELDVR